MPSNAISESISRLEAAEADVLVVLQRAIGDNPQIYAGARGLSHLGEHALGWLLLAGGGFVVDKRRRRQWFAVGTAAFCSHAASVVIKRVVRRRRPDDERITVGVGTPSKLSFPSSHATSTTATMVALADMTGNKLPLLGIPVMMISRMVLGVHYPTDTLAGAAIGATTARACMETERSTR